ncbi:hypothetical protein [Streptomyces sp. NPDC102437]|uniref:hypothetical protein n=1 Tax=Streptomyces sp. NPDC102437 TaxID=3366175 RepID=UPI003807890E
MRYGLRRDTGRFDLDEVRDLARAERPPRWIPRAVEAARTGDEPALARVRAEVKEPMVGYPAPGLPVG